MSADAMIDDSLVGTSPKTAARVIGVSERRLRDWARASLVEPSSRPRVGNSKFSLYSLEDLVQGRVVRILEDKGVPIRQIGLIVRAVRSRRHPHPLASLHWAVSGRQAFVELDGAWYGGRSPAQGVLPDVIDLEEIRTDARRQLRRPAELAGKVARRRGVQGSRPVFDGTRVPVETVVRYVEQGVPDREILESFPTLYSGDLKVARDRIAV